MQGLIAAVSQWNVHNNKPPNNKIICFLNVLYLQFGVDASRFVPAGDAGGNSGEDIQLTTTITHVDGPSELYKMTGKTAQE